MNTYDKVLLALYAISLLAVVTFIAEIWTLSILFILILIISLLQKTYFDEEIRKEGVLRKNTVGAILERVEMFAGNVEELRYNMDKSFFAVENRIGEIRADYQREDEMNYRELVRKILEIENKMSSVKKTYSAAFGSIDDRLQEVEKDDDKASL